MQIIILDHEPYSSIKKKSYFIDEFRINGIEVEYWSLVDALPYTKTLMYNYREDGLGVKYFSTTELLMNEISKLDNKKVILIIELWFIPFTYKLFKAIRMGGIKWARIDYYLNPTIALEPKKPLSKQLSEITLHNFKRKVSTFLTSYFYSKSGYQIPDLLYVTGANRNRVTHANKVVSIDYFDILNFDQIKDSLRPLSARYLVFLDTMLFDHPDILMYGFTPNGNKSQYFEVLNDFFTTIEEKTGYQVVIAGHPKSDYNNEFNGRLCLMGQTGELVRHSEGVITHGSLSISYALLANKPITYIYSSKLFNRNEFLLFTLKNMIYASEILNANLIEMSDACLGNFDNDVLDQKYEAFLHSYYRKDKLDSRENFKIILDNLKQLLHD